MSSGSQAISQVCIMGNHYGGQYDPVWEVDAELEKLNASKGFQVGIHVDAASGGFIAPFQALGHRHFQTFSCFFMVFSWFLGILRWFLKLGGAPSMGFPAQERLAPCSRRMKETALESEVHLGQRPQVRQLLLRHRLRMDLKSLRK